MLNTGLLEALMLSTNKCRNKSIQNYNFITVLYWFIVLRDGLKQGLKVFESVVLKVIFGSKEGEATGGRRNCIIRTL
jgi:hypothetical protein